MKTARINGNAYGVWARREGELVEVVAVKPNGLATGVLHPAYKDVAFIPTRWLDPEHPKTTRRPLRAAHTILEA